MGNCEDKLIIILSIGLLLIARHYRNLLTLAGSWRYKPPLN